MVLWTTTLRLKAAFTKPPAPPKTNEIIASAWAANEASPKAVSVSTRTAAASCAGRHLSDAATVNAVSRLDADHHRHQRVHEPRRGMPGSVNWWWNPTGVEEQEHQEREPRQAVRTLPPACRGTSPVPGDVGGSSQK